jgi:uncharacterized protein YaeQ
MALKPTIYKFDISLSDLDRERYDTLKLTVALHPSESLERMMARVLAFCLNAEERLEFTRGLSDTSEPDLWTHTLDGQVTLWIDVGEPSVERLKKAVGVAERVCVYSFNSKSDVWWRQSESALNRLPVAVYQFPNEAIRELAKLVERTMVMSVTITDGNAYVAAVLGECEVPCDHLTPV